MAHGPHQLNLIDLELHEVKYVLSSSVTNTSRKKLVVHSRITANKIHSSLRVTDGNDQVQYSGGKLEEAIEAYNKLP